MQATYNNSMTKTARVFFGKSIKSQYLYCPNKNWYHLWKSKIFVINSNVGSRYIKVSIDTSSLKTK